MKNASIFGVVAILSFALAVMVSLSGCPKSEENNTPGANEVWIEESAFNPSTKLISAGTTVTWTNKDAATHTVTSGVPTKPSGAFDSGDLNEDGTFSFKFDSSGTYAYYCKHHSGMTGSITVE